MGSLGGVLRVGDRPSEGVQALDMWWLILWTQGAAYVRSSSFSSWTVESERARDPTPMCHSPEVLWLVCYHYYYYYYCH